MLGMILAAGAGRRLRPYTDTLPKALVPVDGDTTIMDIALQNLASVGLTDVVVIVGYRSEAVEERREALERRHGVKITTVFNDKAEEWNNAYSLWTARDYFAEGVVLVNGDTVHPASVEKTLLANRGPEIVLAVDTVKTLADEEMKVALDSSGHLQRITKLMDPRQPQASTSESPSSRGASPAAWQTRSVPPGNATPSSTTRTATRNWSTEARGSLWRRSARSTGLRWTITTIWLALGRSHAATSPDAGLAALH